MASIGAILTSTYYTKITKSMAKLISQSCGELQPAICLSRGDGNIEDNPSIRGHLTSFSNKSQQKLPEQFSVSIPG